MIYFNSDYLEGAHPALMAKLNETNMVQTVGYGEDEYCAAAREKIKAACQAPDADVHFLVGGTLTNTTVIASVLRPYQGVLTAASGHINCHETGAIESSGHKVLALPTNNGKITAQQVEEAYAMARTANIHHINMDVIAGLPGENIDDFARTMDAALRLKPESLTVHTLAIKRSSRLHLENAPLPDGETASRMVQLGLDTAHQLGMKPYYLYRQKYMAGNQENVGYALPGHACQYNVDIMEETTHILALGAGGISKRVYPEEGHIGRAPNVSNIEQYIARVEEMIGRKKALFLPEMPL